MREYKVIRSDGDATEWFAKVVNPMCQEGWYIHTVLTPQYGEGTLLMERTFPGSQDAVE